MHFDFTTPIKALKSHQAMTKREREEQEKEDEIVEEKKKTDFEFSCRLLWSLWRREKYAHTRPGEFCYTVYIYII